jgi:hypothetical protein
MLVAETLGILF